MNEKVIFLDIDGVLNHVHTQERHRGCIGINPVFVARLNEITDRTDAKLVISSTWRLDGWDEVTDALREAGVTGEIIGMTPRLPPRETFVSALRGDEIQAWLDDFGPIDRFVILDDDSDMAHLVPFLVQTEWMMGLQPKHVEDVVARLNGTQVAR